MASDIHVALGPLGVFDYKKLLVNELGALITTGTSTLSGSVNISAPTGPPLVSVHTIGLGAVNPLASNLPDRVSLSIRNKSGTATLYFKEDNTVTADDTATGGWEIGPGEDFNIDLDDSNNFFLISDEAACKIKILQIASTP